MVRGEYDVPEVVRRAIYHTILSCRHSGGCSWPSSVQPHLAFRRALLYNLLDAESRSPRAERWTIMNAVCPFCGAALKPRARFCPACGQALAAVAPPALATGEIDPPPEVGLSVHKRIHVNDESLDL